jgi:hypothetical protein
MSTMVKRVAQALQQEMGTAPFDETAASALAHAAIAAMREPTQEMLDAWIRAPGAIKAGWQAMIDRALRETDDEPVAKGQGATRCEAARRAGAQLGPPDRRSSSQHLIVGVHARSATATAAQRAQALPVVRQMKAGAMISGG